MASTTSNLGLTKPAGTDKALVSVINTNSDILDRSAGGLMDALAIVAQGNTHGAISAGQYVYVHNHGTLAEGLYTANSAIAANATLSTSNLTADASGGLNALNSNLSPSGYTSPTMASNVTLASGGYAKIGKIVIVAMRVTTSGSTSEICSNLPTPLVASGVADTQGVVELATNTQTPCYIAKNGKAIFSSSVSTTPLIISGTYISQN